MDYTNAQYRIEKLEALLEVKRAELAQRINRQHELKAKQTTNIRAKQQFLTRIRLDIKSLTDEINAMNTELWGLYEIAPAASPTEYVW